MRLSTTKTLIGSLCGAAMLSAGLVSCAPKHNTLSEAEIADGWQLLFDGKTLDQCSPGPSWTAASRPKAAAATCRAIS